MRLAGALFVAMSLLAPLSASASGPAPVGGTLAKLAKSPTAKRVEVELGRVTATAESQLGSAKSLLRRNAARLDRFERDFLRFAVQMEQPAMQRAFSSLSSRSPRNADRRMLAKLAGSMKRNAAIQALRRDGLALKRNPAKLQRRLAVFSNAAPTANADPALIRQASRRLASTASSGLFRRFPPLVVGLLLSPRLTSAASAPAARASDASCDEVDLAEIQLQMRLVQRFSSKVLGKLLKAALVLETGSQLFGASLGAWMLGSLYLGPVVATAGAAALGVAAVGAFVYLEWSSIHGIYADIQALRAARAQAGSCDGRGQKVLVVLPRDPSISSGGKVQFRAHLYEEGQGGTRDLGDVTSDVRLSLSHRPLKQCRIETSYCNGQGASCEQGTGVCTAVGPGEYDVLVSYQRQLATVRSRPLLTVVPEETLTIAPESLEQGLPMLNFTQKLEVAGAEGDVTWEAENVSPGASAALQGNVNTGGFKIEPDGLLRANGLIPGEEVRLRVRAWDAKGHSGVREYTLAGQVPPYCPSACLYAGAASRHDPSVPTLALAFKETNMPPGCCAYRLIVNGVELNPWPPYAPNAFESLRSFQPGQSWYVPADPYWYTSWAAVVPGGVKHGDAVAFHLCVLTAGLVNLTYTTSNTVTMK